jgi:hypothetical protein
VAGLAPLRRSLYFRVMAQYVEGCCSRQKTNMEVQSVELVLAGLCSVVNASCQSANPRAAYPVR